MQTLAYAPWRWLVAVPLIALCTLVMGTLVLLLLNLFPARQVNRVIPIWWARINLGVIPATVTVSGREHLDPRQSYVIVANHLSHIDILTVYAHLGLDIRWVMKEELRKVPVIGVASAGLGHVFVNRGDRHAAVQALNAAKQRLAEDGASLLFFPEGTRSRDGRLHAFKKGAFVMAKDMNLPVLPVTLRGTDNVLPALTLGLLPGRTEIIIHRPIAASQVTALTADELMVRSREVIAAYLCRDKVADD
jgi:1-acyl-sn-glycerol-3-phosphate acyltransferase